MILIQILFSGVLSWGAFAQEPPASVYKYRQEQLEEELIKLLEEGVGSGVISRSLRDSVLFFIRSNNVLSPDKFKNLSFTESDTPPGTLPDDKMIVMRDGVPIVVNKDKDKKQDSLLKKNMEEAWKKSLESPPEAPPPNSYIKNGINTALLLPDKLPVPEREGRDRDPVLTPEQLKKKMLSLDYFSKGLDGYYQKLIAMGYVGQGWVETKEAREAIDRIRAGIDRNLAAQRSSVYSTPGFIRRLSSSRSPFKRLLGNLLNMFNNGAQAQISTGYKNNNYMIVTPPEPQQVKDVPKKYD